jgi:hypothetical protein
MNLSHPPVDRHRSPDVPAVGEARLEDLPYRPERRISPAVNVAAHDQK